MSSTRSSSRSDAFRSVTLQPRRQAASCSRARASTVTASGSTPATSQTTVAPLRARIAQTRSQSSARSARAIGPRIANATSWDPGWGIDDLDGERGQDSAVAGFA